MKTIINSIKIGIIFILLLISIPVSNQTNLILNKHLLPRFMSSDKPTPELLLEALNYYKIKKSSIVYAQAILETGHFKSRICKKYNNLFGLYNSKTHDYYKFNNWWESVKAYNTCVQYKYTTGNYFAFLDKLGYAEDSNYIAKVKSVINQNLYKNV